MPVPSWEALTDPKTGRLNPFLPLGGLWVPNRVKLLAGFLTFRWKVGDQETDDYHHPPPDLLERFLRARHDNAILAFAKRFGPLGLRQTWAGNTPDPQQVFARLRRGDEHREPLTSWCRCRQEFSDLLALAAQVREEASIDRAVFARFAERDGVPSVPVERRVRRLAVIMGLPWATILENWERLRPSERRRTAAEFLTRQCDRLVESCGVRPVLVIPPTRARRGELLFHDAIATPGMPGLSLLGALTMQLLAAASGSRFFWCSACGEPFVPQQRKPAFGRRRYCPSCGRKAALRDAKADYRAKLRKSGKKRLGRASRKRGSRRTT